MEFASSQAGNQRIPSSENYDPTKTTADYPPSVQSNSTRNSVVNISSTARKRANLSHLSESDRRSEMSYKSEPNGLISDPTKNSKFKVVKLGDKTPYIRGRFTCFDFHDLPVKGLDALRDSPSRAATPNQQVPDITRNRSDSLTAVANIPQVEQVAGVVQKTGTLVPSPVLPRLSVLNPNSRSSSQLANPISMTPTPAISPEPNRSPLVFSTASISTDHPSAGDLTQKRGSVPQHSHSPVPSRKTSSAVAPDPNRLMKMRGEAYITEMIDKVWDSSAGKGGFEKIESKISQCMSLVTEHVLLAVKADLDDLKSQSKSLKERVSSLEFENYALKTENVLLRTAVNNPPSAPTNLSNPVEAARHSRMK